MADGRQPDKAPGWAWLILHFSSVTHFRRLLATGIFALVAYQSVAGPKIDDLWIGLIGIVVGYYFKSGSDQPHHCPERRRQSDTAD